MRPIFLFAFTIQLIAIGLTTFFFYALIFEPELIGQTVARIFTGFRDNL